MLTPAHREAYNRMHAVCPACGSGTIARGGDLALFNDVDYNPAKCPCGWEGVGDDLAPDMPRDKGEVKIESGDLFGLPPTPGAYDD